MWAGDVWAIGVVAYVMVEGAYPFGATSLLGLFARIAEAQYPPPTHTGLMPLLAATLVTDPAARATLETVRALPLLNAPFEGPPYIPDPLPSLFSDDSTAFTAQLEALQGDGGTRSTSTVEDASDEDTPSSGSFGEEDDEGGQLTETPGRTSKRSSSKGCCALL